MKNKLKIIVYSVIVLDVIYLGIYGFNAIINNNSVDFDALASISVDGEYIADEYNNSKPVEYGQHISGGILTDIAGNQIDLTSKNDSFKFISFYQPVENEIKDDIIANRVDLLSKFKNEFTEWESIVIIAGEIDNKSRNKLLAVSNKMKVQFVIVSFDELYSYFGLQDCKCSYKMILDPENIVRLFISTIENRVLHDIARELQK